MSLTTTLITMRRMSSSHHPVEKQLGKCRLMERDASQGVLYNAKCNHVLQHQGWPSA
jgi:hypothetical protein